MKNRLTVLLGATVPIVVGVVVGRGLWMVGSPAEARTVRLDARRLQDLRQLSASVNVYYDQHHELPISLDALSASPGRVLVDPITSNSYGYRVVESRTYEVCATFEREWRGQGDTFWAHGAGRQCFRPTVTDRTHTSPW